MELKENTNCLFSVETLNDGLSFTDYMRFMERLAYREEPVTQYTEEQLDYARLNYFRMNRMLKKVHLHDQIIEKIKALEGKLFWFVLAEPWCGDAAGTLPVIAALSKLNEGIHLRILLRDEHPELMDRYLTNGTRSIPKLICLNESLIELGNWGPRPQTLTDYISRLKSESHPNGDELKTKIQLWYNTDGGSAFLSEFGNLLVKW